jgi:hypothetical protein
VGLGAEAGSGYIGGKEGENTEVGLSGGKR